MHCLFFCQLTIEKLIKALIIKKQNIDPPITHNLLSLFKKTGEMLPLEYADDFDTMTGFNVEARYDIYKQKLYKQATKSYTERFLTKTKEYVVWLTKQL